MPTHSCAILKLHPTDIGLANQFVVRSVALFALEFFIVLRNFANIMKGPLGAMFEPLSRLGA
jgi:hypothetical protein